MADYKSYDTYDEYDEYEDDASPEITAEDCWSVISSFFEAKGLVAQQIDSYDEFAARTMQEIVSELGKFSIQQNAPPPEDNEEPPFARRYDVEFKNLVLAYPSITEDDGTSTSLWPHEARLRNLTYSAAMFADLKTSVNILPQPPQDENVDLEDTSLTWVPDPKKNKNESPRVHIGRLPIMLKSSVCQLRNRPDDELYAHDECPYDQGGYFIINGSEKVLIAQERSAGNIVQVFKKKQSPTPFVAEIRSVLEKGSRLLSTTTVRLHAKGEVSKGGHGQTIKVSVPYVKDQVPIAILFRALGVVSDEDILNHICFDKNDTQMLEMLKPCIEEGFLIQDKTTALDYLGRRANASGNMEKRIRNAKEILKKEFLPHVSQGEGAETRKAFYLGYIVHRLLQCALGRREEDDRDHFGKKRLDLAGPLMATIFRQTFMRLTKDVSNYLQKNLESGKDFSLQVAVKASTITNGMKYSLATGNWGEQKKAASSRAGVSQVLNRYTFASTLSHLRRTNTPIGRDGKIAKPRQLHNTHWGLVCPAETPEGQACGLVKNLSLMCYVTVAQPSGPIIDFLQLRGLEYLEDYDPIRAPDATKVFVNGSWIGTHRDPSMLHKSLKMIRGKQNMLHESVTIIRDLRDREVRIMTDHGRICRPLFVVDNDPKSPTCGGLKLQRSHLARLEKDRAMQTADLTDAELEQMDHGWRNLVKEGVVEYLDAEEEEAAMIVMTPEDLDEHRAMRAGEYVPQDNDDPHARIKQKPNPTVKEYTHCEIHPSMILGVCASIIPFPDHNQSPRNTYQSAMGKQAMGVMLTNYQLRFDTMNNVLYYPQKPLATTRSMEYLKFRELPAGQNAIVAIACYSGYNQEDSLIMSQSSIDRGLFRSLFYRTYMDTAKATSTSSAKQTFEEFAKPNRHNTVRMKHGTYDKIDADGIAPPGVRVSGEDIIIGKVAEMEDESEELGQRTKSTTHRDLSTPLRSTESGIIDAAIMTTNAEGLRFVKLRTRTTKVPQIGDKFASRHGQKGTIGVTYRAEDMPFTREGLTPDLIINPHAIPSRMTIAHLIECLLSKVGSLQGAEGDATPFTSVTITSISSLLFSAGYQSRGFEVMYNGHTGKKLRAQVFLGPTYYQRLRHMVDDKIHARSRGPVQILTRQPVEGRARDGGLRFGEMERDCMIAHGAASFLKERLFEVSDAYRIHICEICGLMTPIA
jgi:DNA-directed RNA polymerase II subunit RPB2